MTGSISRCVKSMSIMNNSENPSPQPQYQCTPVSTWSFATICPEAADARMSAAQRGQWKLVSALASPPARQRRTSQTRCQRPYSGGGRVRICNSAELTPRGSLVVRLHRQEVSSCQWAGGEHRSRRAQVVESPCDHQAQNRFTVLQRRTIPLRTGGIQQVHPALNARPAYADLHQLAQLHVSATSRTRLDAPQSPRTRTASRSDARY